MQSILKNLFQAADNHAEDEHPDHAVGDLQDVLRAAWGIMSAGQKIDLLNSSEVENVIEMGARGEFTVESLLADIEQDLANKEAEVTKAGFSFFEHENGFYWQTGTEESGDFSCREDAVEDAHKHFAKAPLATSGE